MKVNTKKIYSELKRNHWTITELAQRMGMSRQGIHLLLKKETASFKTINKFGIVFNLDPKDLLI